MVHICLNDREYRFFLFFTYFDNRNEKKLWHKGGGKYCKPYQNVKVVVHLDWSIYYVDAWLVLILCFLYLSEVEIRYITDEEESMCSAFYGALVPLILSVVCNVLCVIRWVYMNRWKCCGIWCYEYFFKDVHHLIDLSEIQLPAGIFKLENKMKLLLLQQHMTKFTLKYM